MGKFRELLRMFGRICAMLPIMLWWEQAKKRRRSLVFALRAGKLCNRRYMAGNFVTGAKSGKACQQQGRENIRALGAGRCVTGDRSAKMRLR